MLSAAEIYGAAPWAVMVTQVMVTERRRSITVGRHQLVFHVCAHIERLPTRWHETAGWTFPRGDTGTDLVTDRAEAIATRGYGSSTRGTGSVMPCLHIGGTHTGSTGDG